MKIIISLVDQLADLNKTWPNIAINDFVTSTKDRVRRIITEYQAQKSPAAAPSDSRWRQMSSPPPSILDPPPEALAERLPLLRSPSTPKLTREVSNERHGDAIGERYKRRMRINASRSSSLQDEMGRRLGEAARRKGKGDGCCSRGPPRHSTEWKTTETARATELTTAQEE